MRDDSEPSSRPMPRVEITGDGGDLFVALDGVRVAKRGRPGTAEAGTWVTLVRGWTVTSPAPRSAGARTCELG